jgi:hypothetical protein
MIKIVISNALPVEFEEEEGPGLDLGFVLILLEGSSCSEELFMIISLEPCVSDPSSTTPLRAA